MMEISRTAMDVIATATLNMDGFAKMDLLLIIQFVFSNRMPVCQLQMIIKFTSHSHKI